MALASVEGVATRIFSLSAIGAHLRLLLAIPLFFLWETWMDPRVATFMRSIIKSGVVPDRVLPALKSETRRIGRLRDAWLPEAVCLILAVLMGVLNVKLQRWGSTATYDATRAAAPGTVLAGLYWGSA